jgi:hypothetical protein
VSTPRPFDFFATTYGVKYDKAVAKLTKDRDVLLAFYDFPAEHWKHIRTTQSRAPLPPSGIALENLKAVSAAKPVSPWR